MAVTLKTKISTPNLTESRAFYETIFGMVVAGEWDEPDDKGVILKFEDGGNEGFLEIYHTPVTHDFKGLSLQFRVDDLKGFIAKLPTHLEFDGPTPRPWGSTYLYLRDPAGIQVIVYEGGL